MNLKEYLARKKIKMMHFALEIGYHPNYISSISTGRIKPSKKLIRAVQKETNGQVTFEEFKEKKSDITKN